MKKIGIILVMILWYHAINAQNSIKGKITDENKVPLTGTTVFIPELNKGTVSDKEGNYELMNLPNGRIRIQFSFVGYSNHIETLQLYGESLNLNVVLKPTTIATEEIVVSGGYNATQHENAVKIDVLKLNPFEIKSTPNFMETLMKIPGVDMISKGSGVSKPVIRGLSMNDILVLNNGVRFENYQYSSHHPLGIDEFGIQDVEVIKGPASLLYGSDAIGGVINFIKEKPAPIGSLMGDYNLQLFSNTYGITNNIGLKGASKKVFGGLRFGQKSNADFRQGGGDFAPNSRFNEVSLKTNFGFTDKVGTFKLYYDFNNQKLGLVEDEAIEEITERGRKNEIWYQEFNTHLLSSQNKIYVGRFKLDLNSAYQSTALVHFEDAGVVELQMKLETFTYEAKLYLPSQGDAEYILGFQGFNQRNKNLNDREVILLPNATTANYSAFGLVQFNIQHKLKLQTGIRYDYKTIETQAVEISDNTDTYRVPLSKSYGSFSGSVGGVYNFSEGLFLRTNLAAAYRTPNLAELTSDGQHELRYEVGDNNLVPENSYEADLSLHLHRSNITFDVAGFYNFIYNYIFIAPTGNFTNDGIGIYKYNQTNSKLFGGEAGIHFHPVKCKWLHFETTFSSVTGKKDNGDYLPFIPANKLKFEVRAEKKELLFFENTFFTMNSSFAFAQNNAAPDETATAGYHLIDLSAGGNIKVNNQNIAIKISATNIFDSKYIDHLSTLKEVGLYNPGRNIAITVKVPFGIVPMKN
ncbi:MAG: TonB-dependent receptor [Prolixibacteraceae bacterium]|nr:TonB-dependent receptor [Prolixibacteraceae bacterium]